MSHVPAGKGSMDAWLACRAYGGSAARHMCTAAGPGAVGGAPATQLKKEDAVDASRGARRPWQQICVNFIPRADTKITDAEQGDLASCRPDLSQAPSAPKSADLTKAGRAREHDDKKFGYYAWSLMGGWAWVGRRSHHQDNSK